VLTDTLTVNTWGCGEQAPHSGVTFYNFGDCSYLGESDYEKMGTTSGLFNLSVLNNKATSIHLPYGMSVTLYEGPDGTGESWTVNSDMWNMDIDHWPSGLSMNNTISSIEIFNYVKLAQINGIYTLYLPLNIK
jgi:hypothetical protein